MIGREHTFVCGPCVARVLDAGGARVPVQEIELGTECEVHLAGSVQATNAVRLPDDWSRERPTAPELRGAGDLPREAGVLTQTALTLLAAWSGPQGYADAVMVQASVGVAEQLLRLTKGA